MGRNVTLERDAVAEAENILCAVKGTLDLIDMFLDRGPGIAKTEEEIRCVQYACRGASMLIDKVIILM